MRYICRRRGRSSAVYKEIKGERNKGVGNFRHLCSSQQSVVNRYLHICICNIFTLWTNNAYQCYFLTLPVLPDPPA